jgi:hypothetical protein
MCSISIDARTNRLLPAMALAFVASASVFPAFGQDKLRDPAAAEALYLSGRKLVAEGNWAEGCEKFRASMELNPAASTLINIAKCSEHEGKLTQAVVEYRRASQLNQDTLGEERKRNLEQVLKESIGALEPRLARVQLVVASRPNGIEIKRDGLTLPIATIGETMPLDPGEHMFVMTAPRFRKQERKVVLKEGESQTIDLPLVADEKSAGVVSPPVDKRTVPDKPCGGVPVWAFVVGGVGLAALGGAIYFKLEQADAEKALIEHCGVQLECDPNDSYDPAADNVRKNRSFGLFVGLGAVGAAGIGTAILGFAQSGRSAKPKKQSVFVLPYVGRGDGGVMMRGAF